ncbi:MAG: DUF2256 domain-containing protein [Verrucomicrobiota bacterium]|nr:DUF2256 domain-containing protein [Verrucomicrobiota bacterium]MEC8243936.1 DUF2256 domain-containing protein [Verrucomicrobiota bacterium]
MVNYFSYFNSCLLPLKPNIKNQTKVCPRCGRSFSNRKKWQSRGIWDQVLYCSVKCRGAGKKLR